MLADFTSQGRHAPLSAMYVVRSADTGQVLFILLLACCFTVGVFSLQCGNGHFGFGMRSSYLLLAL